MKIGNKLRANEKLVCGEIVPARVIANIGTTYECDSFEEELQKATAAEKAGADIITDHSLAGNFIKFQKKLIEQLPCAISAVSIYEASVNSKIEGPEDFIDVFEKQAMRGLDLITIHATIFREDLTRIATSNRLIPCTSRGGMMLADIFTQEDLQNPYWTHFSEILDICREYEVALSLGTSFRFGSIIDQPDELYYLELERMGQLVKRAKQKNVDIMVEGIGHARIDEIPKLVMEAKLACSNVPYRVLSVACDAALHRDHISSAIAAATAVAAGADVISAVSRAEHVSQPTIENVVEAVETAKIAAHCGDLARRKNLAIDHEISRERGKTTSCLASGKQTVTSREDRDAAGECSMCGPFCALRTMRKIRERGLHEN